MHHDEQLAKHKAWFAAYVENFVATLERKKGGQLDTSPLLLKIEHTAKVLANTTMITRSQGFMDVARGVVGDEAVPEFVSALVYACHLAALYHDIGRFPQYRDYATFADALSVNHATLSARTLAREGVLMSESQLVRSLVVGAVALHNRYVLPNGISDAMRLVTDVVRDADKLDIIRIMAPQLSFASLEEARKQAAQGGQNVVTMHVKDEPELWSDIIAQDAMAGRVAKYTDMRYINDFRILICTWMKELCFAASLEHLAKSGLMLDIVAGLPKNDFMAKLIDHVLKPLEPYHE